MTEQTKLISFIEACTNTAVGFGVALTTWYLILLSGLFHIQTTHSENFTITFIFTLISVVRGYILRRTFVTYHLWLMRTFK